MNCNLVLHCGADSVSRNEVVCAHTPSKTRTWQPVPHQEMLSRIESRLPDYNLSIVEQAHSLTHDGGRYFGLMQIQNGSSHPDYSWVLGVRNSHDKAFAAGIVAGAQVFVCDNLSFSGEIKVARKHTRYIRRDLPELIDASLEHLVDKWKFQDRRIDAYKNTLLTDARAHDLVVRGLDRGACCGSQIPGILDEWRNPSYDEFSDKNAWGLFNAFTERLKGSGLHTLANRTEKLHSIMDSYVGLN